MAEIDADIVVVGGGIGGLSAALQLARRGVQRVTLLERAAEFGELGAGIQVAPNASRVLEELGVLESVARTAFFPERLVLKDALDGEEIGALHTGHEFRARFGYPYMVAHRADLHRTLLDACLACENVALISGATVTRVTQDEDGAQVHCQDGRVFTGGAVVGADGIDSTIREQLLQDGPPESTGYVAYRGCVPVEEVERSTGSHKLTDMVIWAGPGMHLVQYPVRGGALCNQVAVFRSQQFRDGMADWGGADELAERFEITSPAVRRSVGLVDVTRRWNMFDREPRPGWVDGRIALLGDAAHPMYQYLAQGACQALEDARALGQCVASGLGVEQALKAYESQRYERASLVQTRARLWGEVIHASGGAAGLRNYFFRRRDPSDVEPIDWLYSPNADATTLIERELTA